MDEVAEKLDHLYQRLDLIGDIEEDDDTDPVGGPKLNIATTTNSVLCWDIMQLPCGNKKRGFMRKHYIRKRKK